MFLDLFWYFKRDIFETNRDTKFKIIKDSEAVCIPVKGFNMIV